MDKNSLAHTKWECKYHIVFASGNVSTILYLRQSIEEKLFINRYEQILDIS